MVSTSFCRYLGRPIAIQSRHILILVLPRWCNCLQGHFLSHAHFLYHLCRLVWILAQSKQTENQVIGLLCIVFHMIFFCLVIYVIYTFLNCLIPWVLLKIMCWWGVIHIFYTKGIVWEMQVIDMGNKSKWTKKSSLRASCI